LRQRYGTPDMGEEKGFFKVFILNFYFIKKKEKEEILLGLSK
jgi:hypothetical protein